MGKPSFNTVNNITTTASSSPKTAKTLDELSFYIAQLEAKNTALSQQVSQLQTQNSFLHTLIDNIPIAMFVKNARDDFRITEWNKAAKPFLKSRKRRLLAEQHMIYGLKNKLIFF